jgi:protease IV
MALFKRSKNRVAIVKVEGVITDGDSVGTDRARIVACLKEAERRKARAVVLRVNSPGGTVAACQEVFAALVRLKGNGIPVVASMGDMAASGGVYIAMAATQIVANPGTITGSIGVIIKGNDLSALYQKVGVSPKVVKSGAHKDMFATYRPLSPDEQVLLQGLIDDSFDQFVETIASARQRARSEIESIADGRILTGRQAHKAGLVDLLGDLDAAIDRAGELAGIEGKPKILPIVPRRNFRQRLLSPILGRSGTGLFGAGVPRIPMWILPDF